MWYNLKAMNLIIDTSDSRVINLKLMAGGRVWKKKKLLAGRRQAEKLLPAIDKLRREAGIDLKELEKIQVAHRGDSFTSLRIGILTANALAYALGLKVETWPFDRKRIKKMDGFDIALPQYHHDLVIKIKKNELD